MLKLIENVERYRVLSTPRKSVYYKCSLFNLVGSFTDVEDNVRFLNSNSSNIINTLFSTPSVNTTPRPTIKGDNDIGLTTK